MTFWSNTVWCSFNILFLYCINVFLFHFFIASKLEKLHVLAQSNIRLGARCCRVRGLRLDESLPHSASSSLWVCLVCLWPKVRPKLVACFCPSHPQCHIIIAVAHRTPSFSPWNRPNRPRFFVTLSWSSQWKKYFWPPSSRMLEKNV